MLIAACLGKSLRGSVDYKHAILLLTFNGLITSSDKKYSSHGKRIQNIISSPSNGMPGFIESDVCDAER